MDFLDLRKIRYSGVIKLTNEAVEELLRQFHSTSESTNEAHKQLEQMYYEITFAMLQLDATIRGPKEEAKYDHLEWYSRPCFREFLEMEVGKFDKHDETFVNVDGVRYRKESVGKVKSIDNEYSVVTLLVLADGEYLIPSLKGYTPHVKKVDIKTALQTIHWIPMSNLEAVKVLWTPQMGNDIVSEQEVRRDFGLLMRPVDLTE